MIHPPRLPAAWHTLVTTIRNSVYLRRLLIVTWHLIGVYVAYGAAFLLRFDGHVPPPFRLVFWYTLPILLLIYLAAFALFQLYSGMWSFFSIDDAVRMGLALICASLAVGIVIFPLRNVLPGGYPRSALIVTPMLMGIWMSSARLGVRYWRRWRNQGPPATGGEDGGQDRILVVGQPEDADLMVRAARQTGLRRLVGLVTDDPQQHGLSMHGLPINGPVSRLGQIAATTRANCVIVLPPFNRPRQLNDIVEQCATAGLACTFRTVPSLGDLAGGQISASAIRNVDVEDLLGRGPARFDRTEVRHYLKGKRVMVTGAGGSIGAELCRQIAGYDPECLVLFELSEFALYTIEQELAASRPNLRLIPCAGNVEHHADITAAIHRAGHVDIVYHAAAYKHVPLMEQNVSACFRTNVLGTAELVRTCREFNVDRFVLISSDKAVHPTSIMGATKRLAERVISTNGTTSHTTFVSVRFGNVLGSSGSVIPLFKRQIAAGGPVTVTTPEVRRFFMTIPEAVDLVLLAGTIGCSRDIMVLEMGESIRIVDLARRLIELSGLVPDKDIRITFTGMRPGEKEYEEVMTADENVVRTAHEKIWVLSRTAELHQADPPVDLAHIESLVAAHHDAALRTLAAALVPDNRFAATPSTPAASDGAGGPRRS